MYDPKTTILYSVDERKMMGVDPWNPLQVLCVFCKLRKWSFKSLNEQIAPGPCPTFLSLDSHNGRLFSANHGDF